MATGEKKKSHFEFENTFTCSCHPYAGDHPPPLAKKTLASLYSGGLLAETSLQSRTVRNILSFHFNAHLVRNCEKKKKCWFCATGLGGKSVLRTVSAPYMEYLIFKPANFFRQYFCQNCFFGNARCECSNTKTNDIWLWKCFQMFSSVNSCAWYLTVAQPEA